MTLFSAIVAMSANRVIGKDNQLPWHLPADLRHFKELTLGKTIVMGRKTYESIGKLLPGRKNVILTHNKDYQVEGAVIIHALEELNHFSEEEIFIIGGEKVFRESWPKLTRIYLTEIHAQIEGDTYFPELSEEWRCVQEEKHTADEKNAYNYSFKILELI